MRRESDLETVRAVIADCKKRTRLCIDNIQTAKRQRRWWPAITLLLCILLGTANYIKHDRHAVWVDVVLGIVSPAFQWFVLTLIIRQNRHWKMKFAELVQDGEVVLKRLENPYEN